MYWLVGDDPAVGSLTGRQNGQLPELGALVQYLCHGKAPVSEHQAAGRRVAYQRRAVAGKVHDLAAGHLVED